MVRQRELRMASKLAWQWVLLTVLPLEMQSVKPMELRMENQSVSRLG